MLVPHLSSRQVRRRAGQKVTAAWRGTDNVHSGLLQQCADGTANVHTGATIQRVQKAATWLVFGLGCLDHITHRLHTYAYINLYRAHSLLQLHWLPVSKSQVQTLLCNPRHLYYGRSPTYLTEAVESVTTSRSHSGLCSSSTSLTDYSLPWLHARFGERTFSCAVFATWNAQPVNICTVALKTVEITLL